ncbi:ORFL182C [Human betaherpesvirus 5]|nr:ORFL182C [Human betaherpesvirus 5]QHX40524.1 ORFL182C [Human betaherpesvirus 5]
MSSKTTRISSEYTQASQTTRQTDGAGSPPLSWGEKR